MTSVTSSFEKLIASIFGVFNSILTTILAFFQSLLALGQSAISTAFELVKSTIAFVYHNAFVILVVAGGFIAFGAYQQRVQKGKSGIPTVNEIKARSEKS